MTIYKDQLLAEIYELKLCILDGNNKEAKKRAGRISRMCDKAIQERKEREFDQKVSDSEIEASLSALVPDYRVGGEMPYTPWPSKEQN